MAVAPGAGDLQLRHRAEQAAARLPPLLVAAERVANTVLQGVHGRRRVGTGETFWQFRRYQSGDPAELIDWRQSARSQKLFVRENEWEAAQSVWLWRDASASMDWRSGPALPTKRERAEVLLLAAASLLTRGGERVALLGPDRVARSGRAAMEHLTRLLLAADPRPGATPESLPPAVDLPRFATAVLLGDFLSPVDAVRDAVRRLADQGARGLLLALADPAEDELPFRGRMRFRGPEGEGELTVGRVEALRQSYLDLLAARRAALTEMCRGVGWSFLLHRTDHPPEAALLALYGVLAERRYG